jgi:hypothetical protein
VQYPLTAISRQMDRLSPDALKLSGTPQAKLTLSLFNAGNFMVK